MLRFGVTNPILVDEGGKIIAGHARVAAADLLGLKHLPVIRLETLSETEVRAYMLADNKLALNAGWNLELLASELRDLGALLPEINLDLSITGFDSAEIDSLMGDLVDPEREPADEVPDIAERAVSITGDVWLCERHQLHCGDATRAADVRTLMGRDRAAMVFADPPYNVRIASIVGRGRIRHREFAAASGEMSRDGFTAFLVSALGLAAEYSVNGAIHYVCMDWRHQIELLTAGEKVYTEFKNLCVWAKTNAGQGTFYRSQHELIFVYKHGDGSHLNNFELGQHGRSRSNVWNYAGVNSFRAGRLDDLSVHPTVKPVALVADAMRDCSRRGDVVLDPFMGSGTTIIAAERVGRRAFGLEIDPLYVDAAVRRWQAFTKRDAILKATSETFSEVAEIRAAAVQPRGRR